MRSQGLGLEENFRLRKRLDLKLREMAGTKLDPYLTEQFIQLLHDVKENYLK